MPATHTAIATALRARVLAACRCLAAAGERHGGLIPSLLQRDGREVWRAAPAIPGQRENDRSIGGSNLMHDHPTLKLMLEIAGPWDAPALGSAAERYLDAFAVLPTTPSGLFPWGEHAFWDLEDQRVGNSFRFKRGGDPATHDHLRQAPPWLWDRLWARDPARVVAFARGLDNHRYADADEYMRHAPLLRAERNRAPGPRSCDFPRHSGHYVLDIAYVLAQRDDAALEAQLGWFLDYWWTRKHASGLCYSESRSPATETKHHDQLTLGQTWSLAASLLDAAALLDARRPQLAATCRERAAVYDRACRAAGHDYAAGELVGAIHAHSGERQLLGIWGSRYGAGVAIGQAITALALYEHLGDEELLAHAAAATRPYLETPLPGEIAVPAKDPGAVLMAAAGLYRHSGEASWLEGGLRLGEEALARWWGDDAPLPRIALGHDHYEAQQMPAYLLHGLAELALLAEDRDQTVLTPDRSAR